MAISFKKGDVVLVDEEGKAVRYEILSMVTSTHSAKNMGETIYDAKNVATGARRNIVHEDILRLATPVDSSEDLFSK